MCRCVGLFPDGLPRLDRIREFRLLLDYLGTCQASEINVPQLRQQLTAICRVNGPGTVWTGMADRILAAIEDGSGGQSVPAMDVTEMVRQGLADHNRSHLIGHGVLVSTIHAQRAWNSTTYWCSAVSARIATMVGTRLKRKDDSITSG